MPARRLLVLFLSFFLLLGCSSGPSRQDQLRAAFQAGQQAGRQAPVNTTTVLVMGSVRHHEIPWTEGLTLSQAIVTAEYTGLFYPSTIFVLRAGIRHPIDPKALLDRKLDPLVEPGDVIELVH